MTHASSSPAPEPPTDLRERILDAAAAIIRSGGPDAATTRAVAVAAGVQAPTIYRLFGDKGGLLEAVAERELEAYVAAKTRRRVHPDPVEALRQGWDDHVAFGLGSPGLYALMSANTRSPASQAGLKTLEGRIHAIAAAGRLRVPEGRAVAMVHAACVGAVLSLLAVSEQERDDGLSVAMREALLCAITIDAPDRAVDATTGAAVTLRASLAENPVLSVGEKALMDEWLTRIAVPSLT